AIDDIGDVVPDGVAAQTIGDAGEFVERRTVSVEQCQGLVLMARVEQRRWIGGCQPQSSREVVGGEKGRIIGGPDMRGDLVPIAIDRVEIPAAITCATDGVHFGEQISTPAW